MNPPPPQTPAAPAAPADSDWPRVSIIIITKGRRLQAEAAVASVLTGDYPDECREVVVVEETAQPRPMAGSGVRYHAIPEAERGFPWARNEGVRLATHEVIAFTDDDCLVERGWLKALVAPLRTPGPPPGRVAAVAGAVLVPPCGPIGECESILGFPGGGVKHLHRSGGRLTDWPTFSTCNCAVRRDALLAAGGFDESLRHGGEDERLARRIRATGRILYQPAAVVRHAPRDSLPGVWRWFVRRGRAQAEALRSLRHPGREAFRLARNSPLLRLAALLAVLGALAGWFAPPILAGLGAGHAALMLWRFRWASRYYPGWRTRLWLPVVKAAMDTACDWGMIRGLCGPNRSVT